MAHTAITDPEMKREIFEEDISDKVDTLVQWIRNSRRTVVFTGAGISTSCGIPDFRGPEGVWTLQAEGRERTKPTTSTTKAIPSKTHMSLVKLQEEGLVKYLISQNCDGLHRRSGIHPTRISELHGNSNIEYCITCGQQYLRDFACHRVVRGRDHFTGRYCVVPGCGGKLWDSTIDFGQNLPEKPLELAYKESGEADLHIVLGSSLTVSPACDMPRRTKKKGGRLVIVNLQKTPLTDMADMHIHQTCDVVMTAVMERLGLAIPEWRLRRRLMTHHVYNPATHSWRVQVRGVDINDSALPATIFRNAAVAIKGGDAQRVVEEDPAATRFTFDVTAPSRTAIPALFVRYEFMGHYHEPDLRVPYVLDHDEVERAVDLEYNPFTRSWNFTSTDVSRQRVAGAPATADRAGCCGAARPPVPSTANTTTSTTTSATAMDVVTSTETPSVDASYDETPSTERPPPPRGVTLRTAEVDVDGDVGGRSWAAAVDTVDEHGEPIMVMVGGALKGRGPANRTGKLAILQKASHAWSARAADILEGLDADAQRVLARWNATASVFADRPQEIYLIGGWDWECQYSDVHVLDLHEGTLRRVRVAGREPQVRAGHSATVVDDRIVVFGGAWCNGGPYVFSDDLCVFERDGARWSGAKATGAAPCARAQHSAVLVDSRIYVFGGTDGERALSDVHVLDVSRDRMQWSRVEATGKHAPRAVAARSGDFSVAPCRSTATLLADAGRSLVAVVGLRNDDGSHGTFVFDTATNKWRAYRGDGPAASCHVASATLEGLITFGGEGAVHETTVTVG